MTSVAEKTGQVKPLVDALQEAKYPTRRILTMEQCDELESAERLANHWQGRAKREETRFACHMARVHTEEARALAQKLGVQTCVRGFS